MAFDPRLAAHADIARGRKTELDALNGFLVRRGDEFGVPTPVDRTLWALVKLREQVDSSD